MGKESVLQSKIKDYLKKRGWLVYKRILMSESGLEDLECFRNGVAMFIEVKDFGKKPDPIQWYHIEKHIKAGFISFYTDSFESFKVKYNEKFTT